MPRAGSSFPFSDLAAPAPPLEPEPVPSLFSFDPDKVRHITFRWTRAMLIERVEGPVLLGPDFHPQGMYVFASDYTHLLQMYHDLLSREDKK